MLDWLSVSPHSFFLSDKQSGFLFSISIVDALTIISKRLSKALCKNGEALSVALGVSNAFDRVWHASLTHKSMVYGIFR